MWSRLESTHAHVTAFPGFDWFKKIVMRQIVRKQALSQPSRCLSWCAETHASLLSSLPKWFWQWLNIYIDKPSQGCLQAWFIYVTFLPQAWFKSATSPSILIQKWYFFFQLDSKFTLLLEVWFCQFFLCQMSTLPSVTSLSDDDADAPALPAVDCLSDDEEVRAKNQPRPASNRSVTSKRKRTLEAKVDISKLTKRLQAVTSSHCKCRNPHCRDGFRTPSGFERLVQFRLHLFTLEKPQQDSEASWYVQTTELCCCLFCCFCFLCSDIFLLILLVQLCACCWFWEGVYLL